VRLFSTLIPVIMFVANLATVTILAMGAICCCRNHDTREFCSFQQLSYTADISDNDDWLHEQHHCVGFSSYARINEVLDAPATVESGTIDTNIKGDIEVKMFHFPLERSLS